MGGCKGFGGIYKSTWHHNSKTNTDSFTAVRTLNLLPKPRSLFRIYKETISAEVKDRQNLLSKII
jgi:hypothetical protein